MSASAAIREATGVGQQATGVGQQAAGVGQQAAGSGARPSLMGPADAAARMDAEAARALEIWR